jgi:DNA invertase Pin-like site-specific DNA recombinase
MRDAGRRKFGMLLVPSLDCFARSLGELPVKVNSLRSFGIRFLSAEESIDIDQETWNGRMFLHTLSVLVRLLRESQSSGSLLRSGA